VDADVAVIGTGTMGSMSAWRLAEAGASVLAFEQFGIGHDRSAAGGETRIFRTAYLEGPEYVPILQRSQQLWRELEAASGRALLTATGALMIGRDGTDHMRNVLESVRRFGLAHEVLDRAELGRRYPQHVLADGEFAVLDSAAGVLRPEFAVIAATERAVAHGARVLAGTPVLEVAPDADGVTVRTADRSYRAGAAVLTAGPWTARLAPGYAGVVRPKRIIMTWFAAADPALFTPDRFPVFIRDYEGLDVFGIPSVDGGSVKVALADPYGEIGQPEQLDHNVAPEVLAPAIEAVGRFFTGLHGYPHRVSAHMDGYTPDRHPVVGRLPGHPNVIVLGGFSGHGFKMSPAIGQIARDLVLDGKTELPTGHLRPDRFTP
jgi:sarcosine oxidase